MVSQENTMNVGNDAAGYIPVEADFKFKHTDGELALDDNFAAQSFWKDVLIRYFKKISAVIGLILIIIITVFAIIGPGMNDFSYSEQSLTQKNFAPRVKGLEKLGIFDGSEGMKTTTGTKKINYYEEKGLDDLYYWFGSDNFGRDIWTRTWSGARVSLIIAVAAAIIDMVIGMSYGLISGYFGGKVHAAVSGGRERYSASCNRNTFVTGTAAGYAYHYFCIDVDGVGRHEPYRKS